MINAAGERRGLPALRSTLVARRLAVRCCGLLQCRPEKAGENRAERATGGQAMTPLPAEQLQASQKTETVEERFRRLEAVWDKETGHLSSTTRIVGHPAFRAIVALGEA